MTWSTSNEQASLLLPSGEKDPKAVYSAAIALLTRREYGAVELADKLLKKGYAAEAVHSAIALCQQQALQSDQRYAEMIVRARVRQGYGPERICYELQQKKIDRRYYDQAIQTESVDWMACAKQVLHKKYKCSAQQPWPMQQKQKQFLRYRGFSLPLIAQLFAAEWDDE
jgi:regulatory protein